MEFTNQTAIVTGAGSGIGRAVAVALAEAGASVIAADRDLDGARQTAGSHDAITPVYVDITVDQTITALRDNALRQHGRVDIVVNAAGWDRAEPFMTNDAQFWHDVVDINYLGPVKVSRAFLEPMIEAGMGGRLVNLSSDAGRVGSSGETVYAGAKGAVIAFTKSLAREMARHQINVNCVCPGPTDTPLFRAQPERVQEALIKAVPFRRVGTPEEVADAVLFLASDKARFITGQVLSVSGGLTMAG